MGQEDHPEHGIPIARGVLFGDRYKVDAVLGRGGMGTVYRARDLSLGEDIALKVMSFGPNPPPIAILRFRQEVKLARRVTHLNVARVYDIGEHEGCLYLTMELIEGATLRALLTRERCLKPRLAVQIVCAVCAGLAAAHAEGIIHRDIKPTNILIAGDGRIVLTDFGIARSLAEELNLTTGMIGTPYYMSPEQAYGGSVDARSDIFAVGRVLYEMLLGERAEVATESVARALQAHGVQPALAEITLSCLELEPNKRPQSAAALLHALAQIPFDDEAGCLIKPMAELSAREAAILDGNAALHPMGSRPDAEAGDVRSIAVLPFLFRGSANSEYLGDVIADELVDVLSRTRSLRVFGTGSTSKYRKERDPRVIGRQLGTFAVIDGAVQLVGHRVRISVRLADAASGAQRWSDHYEGSLEDLFAFQEVIARRVAEELRVELTAITHGGDAPAAAIQHYLSARRYLRCFEYAATASAALGFARCIEVAPRFTPAFAGHAIACVRAWNFHDGNARPVDWEQAALESVARAVKYAPELAETHLAMGMCATQQGDYPMAVRSLLQTLAIAPTCAEALEYLGMLECEAGSGESGSKRLKLSAELEPRTSYALSILARRYALYGHIEACDELLARMEQRSGSSILLPKAIRSRTAAWNGERAMLSQIAAELRGGRDPYRRMIALYVQSMLGEFEDKEIISRFTQVNKPLRNRRRRTLNLQLVTEVFASRGSIELALAKLTEAVDLILFDLEWLTLCPLLKSLRSLPEFAAARRRVQARIDAIWTI